MTDQNNAAQAAEQEIEAIMEQAQVFASAWAFYGGPFDQGEGKEQAEREEATLRDVIRDVLSKLRAEGVQAGDEQCKRCGGPGWYTSHTTGYPESIPCSACNPQGVSAERLEKDPFLAAQLWRKPADGAEALLGRILEHVSEYGESMASSTLLSVRSIARRNVETRIAAELAAASTTSVPGFVDAYEGAREDLAIWKRRALEAERDLRAERETSSRLVAALNAENGPTHFGDRAALASAPVAEPRAVSDDFAQEVWAAAQSPHGEPVEKSVARVASLLAEASAPVADERAAQGYGSPADVAQRIEQYLYHDGRKNSATQLLYEAMKALRASPGNRNDE